MNLYQRNKIVWPLFAALLLLPVVGAWAQGSGTAAPAPTKVAIINVRQAIVSTAEGKQASAELQTRFSPQQAALQKLQQQIQDLQNRLNNGAATLSDDEKGRLQRQGELLAREYQRRQADLTDEVNDAQQDMVDTIGRKMLDVLDRYSQQHGFAVVLDTSAQSSPVIYGASQVDITQEIIHLYDQAHPVKESGAASSSGATHSVQPGTARRPKK